MLSIPSTGPMSKPKDDFDKIFSDPFNSISTSFDPQRYAFMRNVLPVPCHSHNDYWRRTPLYAAIASGCISVEADVWLLEDDLFVGHDAGSLIKNATLKSMYLEPLEKMLRTANTNSQIGNVSTDSNQGIFSMEPEQTLVLLVDLKTSGAETFVKLREQLETLRNAGWLTHWNGTHRSERPITVVVSGNAPFDMITANDTIFFDAPLTALASEEDRVEFDDVSPTLAFEGDARLLRYKYNPSNSWYASSNIKAAGSISSFFSITDPQIENLARHVRLAEMRGLKSRYWGTPRWPRTLRDQIWQVLLQQGTSILNVDDLRAARKGSWGRWKKLDRGS
ncbi:hypothetical protein D6C86_05303 [Aureobasidium pullulans]|nr:hypothetical protein D6C86_05303 [Aureobasidium pullulans]